jgi:hypothetical protein
MFCRFITLAASVVTVLAASATASQQLKPADFLPEMNQPVAPVQIIAKPRLPVTFSSTAASTRACP